MFHVKHLPRLPPPRRSRATTPPMRQPGPRTMPRTHRIASIPADGIGPEVISAGLEVLSTPWSSAGCARPWRQSTTRCRWTRRRSLSGDKVRLPRVVSRGLPAAKDTCRTTLGALWGSRYSTYGESTAVPTSCRARRNSRTCSIALNCGSGGARQGNAVDRALGANAATSTDVCNGCAGASSGITGIGIWHDRMNSRDTR